MIKFLKEYRHNKMADTLIASGLEYPKVVRNTSNIVRLFRAWTKPATKDDIYYFVYLMAAEEKITNLHIKYRNNSRNAFAKRKKNGKLIIKFGDKDVTIGLIFHEFAHALLYSRNIEHNHGMTFTLTLDMLLHKYEKYWRHQ